MSTPSKTRVEKEHEIIGNRDIDPVDGFSRNDHHDAQWFNGAGLGLFIHYGISAVDGTVDLSWGMMRPSPHSYEKVMCDEWGHAMPPRLYWELAKKFKAENFAPEKWLAEARKAGFKYAVFTTRHHDGLSLWPSEYGDFSTKNYMGGRDLVGEYIEACRNNGLKVGLYYSGPDWYLMRDYTNFSSDKSIEIGIDFQPEKRKKYTETARKEFHSYLRGQINELLSRYGKIDLLWFDGSLDNAIDYNEIRKLQPGIIFNTRGLGYGDFYCSEQKFPEKDKIQNKWFECCEVFTNNTWGYTKSETYRPVGWFLYELSRIRSLGGNLLINMAPKADGDMPDIAYKRFAEIKEWMDIYSDSVFGITPGPWPEKSNVPVTIKDNIWYLHAHWRTDFELELFDVEKPYSVEMFNGQKISFEYDSRNLKIILPWEYNHHTTDVVKVFF
jgi:alpha-L-fucosidase